MNCGTAIEWPGTTRYMYSIFVVTKVVAYTHPLRLNEIYCRAQSKRLQKSCKLDTVAFNILISYIDDFYSVGEYACVDESFYSFFSSVYLNIMYSRKNTCFWKVLLRVTATKIMQMTRVFSRNTHSTSETIRPISNLIETMNNKSVHQ